MPDQQVLARPGTVRRHGRSFKAPRYLGRCHLGCLRCCEFNLRAIDLADTLQAGPEFISMVSGETARPRRVLPRAFNSTIYRVLFFYVGLPVSLKASAESIGWQLHCRCYQLSVRFRGSSWRHCRGRAWCCKVARE